MVLSCLSLQSETDDIIKRIQQQKGVTGTLILNTDGKRKIFKNTLSVFGCPRKVSFDMFELLMFTLNRMVAVWSHQFQIYFLRLGN